MLTAHAIAAARTVFETLSALRQVTGKTDEVRSLNAAIDVAIEVADRMLREAAERPARRPGQVARRFGEG